LPRQLWRQEYATSKADPTTDVFIFTARRKQTLQGFYRPAFAVFLNFS